MARHGVVLYEKKENIAILTFNRPEALNALNTEVNIQLIDKLDTAEKDAHVKVIVLTGSGEKAFVAGADIKEMIDMDAMRAREHALKAKRAVDKIYHLTKPVIAAVNGFCLGGGMEYALACDFRVASDNARFGLPEINLGIMPGSAGTQRLPRLIGIGKAKELIYTGSMIDAEQALNLGLINYIFTGEYLLNETLKLAKKIASKSTVALSLIKSAMNKGTEIDLESASMFEIDCFALCFTTKEQKEGMAAFVKKTKG
ncbi:MAG: enoyl-CoA hydratase/isomerase family protein [Deltaproteobacteria bacterium]|nr:enoyl-CoA hydratase/isomerase family protein [Deltaproteobacteria bacterium]